MGAWWVFFVVGAAMAAVACVPLLLVSPPSPSGATTRDDGYALQSRREHGEVPKPVRHATELLQAPPVALGTCVSMPCTRVWCGAVRCACAAGVG